MDLQQVDGQSLVDTYEADANDPGERTYYGLAPPADRRAPAQQSARQARRPSTHTLNIQVKTWHAGPGRAYVGVQTAGQWAPPSTRSCDRYWSAWDHRTIIDTQPVRDEWFVKAHTCSGSAVNPLSPTMVITSRTQPGHRDPA